EVKKRVGERSLFAASFGTTRRAVVVGATGLTARTTDGGRRWCAVSGGSTSDLFAVDPVTAETVTAVGAQGTILRSDDGGASWRSMPSPTTSRLLDVAFVDPFLGCTVGSGGAAFAAGVQVMPPSAVAKA
ncbi:MAG TPA: hypothetical protein PLT83_05920, partial [Thermoleophilia bacterium]|nr:hypothetical protein [Thermoleophilia bacterium]